MLISNSKSLNDPGYISPFFSQNLQLPGVVNTSNNTKNNHLQLNQQSFTIWLVECLRGSLPALWSSLVYTNATSSFRSITPGTQRTNSSTREMGQTYITNSQAATQISWLVRCSPHAPGFTQSNLCNKIQSRMQKIFTQMCLTVSIGPSYIESTTGFSQAPLKWLFPTFYYRSSFFCCLPISSSLEPSKLPAKDTE